MRALDMPSEAAEEALLLLARHVPRDVELGRPLLAQPDDGAVLVATTTAWWWASPAEVVRLVPISGGWGELTTYRHGEEAWRKVAAVG